MGKYIGPTARLCRREGIHLFLKGKTCHNGKCPIQKGPPGTLSRKKKKFKSSSGYVLELREKQKIKRSYGLSEKQFFNVFKRAELKKGKTGENLLILLEKRLDSVLTKSKFACSRFQARQLINHKHISVNGKIISCPQYQIDVGDVIGIKTKSPIVSLVRDNLKVLAKKDTPDWIDIDNNSLTCKIMHETTREDINMPFNEQMVVELYSK